MAAAALLENGHAGRRYTLTGPEVLTIPDKVRAIGAAIGRDLTFVELSEQQARERMRKSGSAEDVIDSLAAWRAPSPVGRRARRDLPLMSQLSIGDTGSHGDHH